MSYPQMPRLSSYLSSPDYDAKYVQFGKVTVFYVPNGVVLALAVSTEVATNRTKTIVLLPKAGGVEEDDKRYFLRYGNPELERLLRKAVVEEVQLLHRPDEAEMHEVKVIECDYESFLSCLSMVWRMTIPMPSDDVVLEVWAAMGDPESQLKV